MLLDHNETKLDIINRKTARKSQNTWRLKNTILITRGQRKYLKKIKNYFKLNKNENRTYLNCEMQLTQCLEYN